MLRRYEEAERKTPFGGGTSVMCCVFVGVVKVGEELGISQYMLELLEKFGLYNPDTPKPKPYMCRFFVHCRCGFRALELGRLMLLLTFCVASGSVGAAQGLSNNGLGFRALGLGLRALGLGSRVMFVFHVSYWTATFHHQHHGSDIHVGSRHLLSVPTP